MSKREVPVETDWYPLITPDELSEPVAPMEWLIRGVWPLGSYGPFGGSKKTLKTYIASVFAIAVAAGQPAFNNDQWTVPEARPVIYYGGEGGREMHKRRLQRIARDVYGIEDISTLPLYLVTDIGPFDQPEFWEALRRNIDQVNGTRRKRTKLALVVLDSLYNYHPADIEVSNLYERGRLLAGLSAPLVDDGISLWVVDHFNKTGSGIDLDRLAQSGMSAWADSWMLFEHGEPPDVPNGSFSISTGIGSRQWGGEEWTLRLDIGPFDKDAGYLTAMKVEAHAGMLRRGGAGVEVRNDDIDAAILAFIDSNADQTKDEILRGVMKDCSVGKARATKRFTALHEDGHIDSIRRLREEQRLHGATRSVSRDLWARATHKTKSTSPRQGRKGKS